jgi:hypothetical protein
MPAPIASTITLIMELFIASLIFYIVYKSYVKNIFSEKLAMLAIGYEVIFNVGYMLYRTLAHKETYVLSSQMKLIAALHGILSLLMLLAVIVIFLMARKNYRQGRNYFLENKIITIAFVFFWIVSLVSGLFLYLRVYF